MRSRPGAYEIPPDRLTTFYWAKTQPGWLVLWARIVRALGGQR